MGALDQAINYFDRASLALAALDLDNAEPLDAAYLKIAKAQIKFGLLQRAKETIEEIKSPVWKAMALMKLATSDVWIAPVSPLYHQLIVAPKTSSQVTLCSRTFKRIE